MHDEKLERVLKACASMFNRMLAEPEQQQLSAEEKQEFNAAMKYVSQQLSGIYSNEEEAPEKYAVVYQLEGCKRGSVEFCESYDEALLVQHNFCQAVETLKMDFKVLPEVCKVVEDDEEY